ncbi:MAG: transposase, partial [Ruminococcus sp.]|nr:transposase [Ruminococcus sp.]
MLKNYKTEIFPTPEQKQIIHKTIGVCRYVYNFYLAHNKEIYEKEERFVSGYDFSKWLNNEYLPQNPETHIIKSGSVSMKAGRYYVSVLVEEPETEKPVLNNFGIGIDLGIKNLAICSNGKTYKNINKSVHIRKIEKSLKRQQRKLSRKYESLKKLSNQLKGVATRQNIQKQKLKVQKLHHRLDCIRTDYINKVISELVKTKPEWITLENLNIKGMMKNRHLSKAIAQQKFFEFRTKITAKCKEYGIELRFVDRFFPSSKTCHNCGCIKSDLKLSDRIYACSECGYTADR